ncbi:hypothetical protein MNBD_CHLOROFLEXI01-2882 [hydrothermal vent metagenome]|uniref:Uncharacterized protein n=1 Tax=hydrothermal vent metagenome TaxID=652676 RepID=A0A3B0W9U7_9ZZZZ
MTKFKIGDSVRVRYYGRLPLIRHSAIVIDK